MDAGSLRLRVRRRAKRARAARTFCPSTQPPSTHRYATRSSKDKRARSAACPRFSSTGCTSVTRRCLATRPQALSARASRREQDVRALRADGWLYLVRGDGRLKKGTTKITQREELYELATDPLEHVDPQSRSDGAARAFARAVRAKCPVARCRHSPSRSCTSRSPLRTAVRMRCAARSAARRESSPSRDRSRSRRAVVKAPKGDGDRDRARGGGGRIDLIVDPASMLPLEELALRRDEVALDADHLLVGPLPRCRSSADVRGSRSPARRSTSWARSSAGSTPRGRRSSAITAT